MARRVGWARAWKMSALKRRSESCMRAPIEMRIFDITHIG